MSSWSSYGASSWRLVDSHWFLSILGLVTFATAWELTGYLSGNPLIPSVITIADSLWTLTADGTLLTEGSSTFLHAGIAWLIGCSVGCVAGVAAGRSAAIRAWLIPFVRSTYGTPRIALYPVIILVFGLGVQSVIILAVLEVFYPMTLALYEGSRSVQRDHGWLSQNVGASRYVVIKDIVIPSALPNLFTGMRVSFPLGLLIIVFTELIGENRGLGYVIAKSQAWFEPADAIAVILVLGVVGLVVDRILAFLADRVVHWEGRALTD